MAKQEALTREQARALDERAIREFGLPSLLLMENAARACAAECERILRVHGVQRAMNKLRQPGSKDDVPRNMDELERWKEGLNDFPEPAVVLCGPGNNGGDGMAVARTLINRGYNVEVYHTGDPLHQQTPEDVRKNAELLARLGVPIKPLPDTKAVRALKPVLAEAALIVDALFGTGLTRRLDDPYLALVQAANESGAPILAVDIPSGLDANTGDVLGLSIRAEVTVTFIAPKIGFFDKAGPSFCGNVITAEIGVPRAYVLEILA